MSNIQYHLLGGYDFISKVRPSVYDNYPSRSGVLLKVVVFLYISMVL